jgi:hypothetical protein
MIEDPLHLKDNRINMMSVCISHAAFQIPVLSIEHWNIALCSEQRCVRYSTYEGVSKSFRTGGLERELQMVQLSASRCNYIAIL